MNSVRFAGTRRPLLLAILAIVLGLGASCILVVASPALAQDGAADGYFYTVEEGDSWGTVAAEVGLSVEDLKAANPDSVRDTDWLLSGEQLFVPYPESIKEQTHVVSAGESWNSIAADYNVSVGLLQAVNPQAIRPGFILFKGEKLVVPAPGQAAPTATPTAEATAPATETATEASTPTALPEEETPTAIPDETVVPSATPTTSIVITITDVTVPAEGSDEITTTEEVTVSEAITASEPVTATVTDAVTGTAVATDTASVDLPACPQKFTEYPELMAEIVGNDPAGIINLSIFLDTCGALVEDAFVAGDFTGDGEEDLVVVYQNPNQESAFIEADMIIFNSSDSGLVLAYRARAAGEVRLLATSDINLDALMDVVWVDTTCGASTCFDTVNVRSWDGSEWADWTDGTITMAYAEIEVSDSLEGGAGDEIMLSGGIYGSVGAGPQRSRVETWASDDGDPYALVEKIYNPSDCLYHTVLDANRAFVDGVADGFANAQALYQQAATNASLIKCWVRSNELEELRSFSLFRLALIAGYQEAADDAAARVAALAETYPTSVYAQVADLWLEAYTEAGNAAAACVEVTAYAEENPSTWEILADYGYTNPSFEAADVCPLLDLSTGDAEQDTQANAASLSLVHHTDTDAASLELAAFPACPSDLAGFEETIPGLLNSQTRDSDQLAQWMRMCTALTGSSGGLARGDINGDGLPDYLFFPSVLSDAGLGPNGAQGAVLIFHSNGSESDHTTARSAESAARVDANQMDDYTLVAAPPIFGLASPLAVDDLNSDRRMDIAWTVEACATFCMLEVQMWTWDGDAYVALIRPGAVIANGEAYFEPAPENEPGDGQQLVLYGGVSGTPEGGVVVAHRERWQSQDAGLYQRIEWRYDRTVDDSECRGLRLVEADTSLQAAPMLGYESAIEDYQEALDPGLRACSIFNLPIEKEKSLLHGLGAFRLIQAYALSGNLDQARATQLDLEIEQPESEYTRMAAVWLADYSALRDPQAACETILPTLEQHADLWQISDHFGYDHPVMSPDSVCYRP